MLDLFTVVWGQMVESLLEVTLPSLLQPENIPGSKALLHCYNFYASEEVVRKQVTESQLYRQLAGEVEINWFPLQAGSRGSNDGSARAWELTSNILHQMKLSAKEGHFMLTVAPDHAYGNGSILNMAKLADGRYNPILYVNPRVSEEGYEAIKALFRTGGEVSNRTLVSIAMRFIEQVAYSIEATSTNSVKVRHNVPTPCLLPDDKIIEIFATNITRYGGYDHILPYWLIELGYPWHLIRDSDIFFFVERGRHLVHETTFPWSQNRQVAALAFFGKEEVIWHGI